MRVLSLCSGYGGLDLAVEAVTGARTVAVCDNDPGASKLLAHRFPHVPNLGDLKTIRWEDWAGVEVMTAGYPCQPFSHAGKRAGTDDPRHIFPDIARGIRIVGPRLVVLENVRGHLALGFDVVLGALADIGYDARWVCLRASDVGACHKRERLFLVATPADAERRGWGRWAPEPQRGPLGRTTTAWRGEDAGESLSNGNGHGKSLAIEAARLFKTPTAQLAMNGGSQHPDKRKSGGHGPTLADEVEHLLPTPTTAPTTGNGHARNLGREAQDWSVYEPAIRRHEAMLGRSAPPPTETGPKGGQRLSPRFVEFLMMLPDGWVTDVPGLTRNEQLKALGNGVVPQQAAAAWALLCRKDARDLAEAVGLAPYWGFDTNRDGGGKRGGRPRAVLRPAQFDID